MRLLLDMLGAHALTATREADGSVVLALAHKAGDRRSAAHEALVRHLRVRAAGSVHRFDADHGRVTFRADGCELFVETPGAPPLPMATLSVHRDGVTLRADAARYRLSPFELRYASDTGVLHAVPTRARGERTWQPVTDLHTHFAGCVRGGDLVRLGAEHGVAYPRSLLDEAGIHVSPSEHHEAAHTVSIANLGVMVRDRLAERLEVPLDRSVTFLEMERIYRLRGPLTKAPSMLVPLLEQIAADYRAMGVAYAELSYGNIVDAAALRAVHEAMPRIERESGVTLRFLVAISRHDDPEWDLDLFERIKTLAGSVYVSGIDVMGHETNATHVFAPLLRSIATWATDARPGFVVRVHAGESPSHPENVRAAIEAVQGHDVELRIGHGLFGVDDRTLQALVDARAIVEFNLDSNVALNHLQSARAVPICRYVDAGVRVVLGSDGYGLYQTSPAAAVQAALIAGLDASHLGLLATTERAWMESARERDVDRLRRASGFVVPDNVAAVHFTSAVVERRRRVTEERDASLASRLKEQGVTMLAPPVDAVRGAEASPPRLFVSIAGAWQRSWEQMTEAQRALVEREMTVFVAGLVPGEIVLVTGGTTFGVEGLVGRAARLRGIDVIAAIVRETPPAAIDGAAMTHAIFVGETLYDKATGLYALVAAHHGVCIFVGGGQIVSDEIQTAQNLRLRFLLMDGVGGASEHHAAEQPAHAFRRAEEALHALRGWQALPGIESVPHWYDGPNPTVDAVIVRTNGGAREVLLVRRDLDAPAEAGKWALPGGYVASAAPRGERWSPAEGPEAACVREVGEETGLMINKSDLVVLGVFEGGGRDPRDTARSWSRTTAFLLVLEAQQAHSAIAGGDDAADAGWFAVDGHEPKLAFDHARILEVALGRLGPAS